MSDTTENRIDVTRPLELSDGTPVTFVEIDEDGDIVVEYPDGVWGYYKPDTGRRYGIPRDPHLRNVAETPAVASKPTFDPTKPVQTRDGRKARIVYTDRAGGEWPIGALVMNENNAESCYNYDINGHFLQNKSEHRLDLINILERIERFQLVTTPGNDHISTNAVLVFPHLEDAKAHQPKFGGNIIKVSTEDGKLISIEVVREDEA
jgi:hypothetical protein